MKHTTVIKNFIRDYANAIASNEAAIFAGAGLSRGAGFVDWRGLLADIAEELELDIKIEHDLIAVAQYHVNKQIGNKARLTKRIVEEFSQAAESTENHRILARLPIRTYWTTNYDTLIEDSLKAAYKIPQVKHEIKQLNNTSPKRDAVVYKMHGDVNHANDAILYKQQYEKYHVDNAGFITLLQGDLISKTFLFLGFSFTDPNLDYVLSRLHTAAPNNHYCFMKKETGETGDSPERIAYKQRHQLLRIDDLRRYGINTMLVDDYSDITEILKEIEQRFLKKTVFISGSAEDYSKWNRQDALNFIHRLAGDIVRADMNIVNGFGWGVGSAVINGALEAIYDKPDRYSEEQLIVRPFPQHATAGVSLADMWADYRTRMISLTGIAIFLFGNKPDATGTITLADGVIKEFDIAVSQGVIPIPVGCTGWAACKIFETIEADPERYLGAHKGILDDLRALAKDDITPEQVTTKVVAIIKQINK